MASTLAKLVSTTEFWHLSRLPACIATGTTRRVPQTPPWDGGRGGAGERAQGADGAARLVVRSALGVCLAAKPQTSKVLEDDVVVLEAARRIPATATGSLVTRELGRR